MGKANTGNETNLTYGDATAELRGPTRKWNYAVRDCATGKLVSFHRTMNGAWRVAKHPSNAGKSLDVVSAAAPETQPCSVRAGSPLRSRVVKSKTKQAALLAAGYGPAVNHVLNVRDARKKAGGK